MTMAEYRNNGPGELHNNAVGFEMDLVICSLKW